jgi:hypothetical protein
MTNRNFILVFPECALSVGDIWPDNDAPDNPTAQDVIGQMRKCGSVVRVIREWNLIDSFEVIGPHDKEIYQ